MVAGRILDADGRPVEGATVYVISAPTSMPDIAQMTGKDGAFAIAAPMPGRYRLGINAAGYRQMQQDVDVPASKPVDIRLEFVNE